MSTLAYSGLLFPPRRHPVRRLPQTVTQEVIIAPADLTPLAVPSGSLVNDAPNRYQMFTASAILAAHLAAAWYLHSQPVDKTPVIEPPPMTVELYKPVVEPPKPLPQKKEPPPPVVKTKEPPLPAVKLPDPPTAPAPVAAEQLANAVQAPPAPEPVPLAPPPEPAEPITQASAKAGYLHNPPPVYPDFAQEQGWEGQVVLKVHVLPSGKPGIVQIKRSSGRKMLDQSALEAVQRWSFAPAKRGQTPIDGWVDVPIDFKISG